MPLDAFPPAASADRRRSRRRPRGADRPRGGGRQPVRRVQRGRGRPRRPRRDHRSRRPRAPSVLRGAPVRFAEIGVHATALDLFGRSAGTGPRPEDFDFRAHVGKLTPDGVGADTAATIAHLRSEAGGGSEHVYSVGFCMGGRISFNQAWREHGLDGVIGFYGGPQGRGPDDETAPVRLAPRYRCKVLGLFGGADEHIPPGAIEEFRRALDAAGVPNEMVVYEGAPHSFFDREFERFAGACDDAWRRMLRFVGRETATA